MLHFYEMARYRVIELRTYKTAFWEQISMAGAH